MEYLPWKPTLTGPTLSRRATLLGLTSVLTMGRLSLAVAAAPTDRRFVVVILRGALDGMSAVVPYGDAGLAALRPELVPPPPGSERGLLDLGGKFGLHPAMTHAHALYQANEFLIVHAVAGNYRIRSHFEAQDCLESGADHRMTSGWLNRAVAAMPAQAAGGAPVGGSPHGASGEISRAIAVGPSVPLLLRGRQAVANWAPHGFAEPEHALYEQIMALNHPDPITGPAIAAGLRDRGFGDGVMAADGTDQPKARYAFPSLAKAAGEMLKAAGRTAYRGAGHRRMGHAHGTNQPPRAAADATRYRDRRPAHRFGGRLGADGRACHDGVRPHRAHQRHRRHRPWHRDGCVPRRWRGRGRPRGNELARPVARPVI